MVARRQFPQIYLPLLAVAITALWPLTAYLFNPLLLPALLVVGGATALILWRPVYGLAAVLALIPFIGAHIPQPASANVAFPSSPLHVLLPLMVFGLILYSVLVYGEDRRPLPGVFFGILLLIAAAVISAFQALDPSKSIPDIFLLITGAGLFVAIVNICRTKEQLLIAVGGALLGLLLGSAQGVFQQITGVYSTLGFVANGGQVLNRVQGSFGHPNAYAGYLTLLLPLAVAVVLSKQMPKRLRVLAGVAAAMALPALQFSYARAAIAALVAGSLLWLVLVRPRTALTVGIVVVLAAVLFTPSSLKDRFSNSSGEDVSLRTDVASSALQIYDQHPIFGVGIGNFQQAYDELNFSASGVQRRLFHNQQLLVPTAAPSQYANTLSEQGLVGIVALAVFTLGALLTAYRVGRSSEPWVRSLGLGIGMSVASLFLYSILETSLQEDQVLALFALLAVAALARELSPVPAVRPRGTSPPPRWPTAAHGSPVP